MENPSRIKRGVGFRLCCVGLFFLHFLSNQTDSKSNTERKWMNLHSALVELEQLGHYSVC